jgi:hypothetical protein
VEANPSNHEEFQEDLPEPTSPSQSV